MFIRLTTPGIPASHLEPTPIFVAINQIHTINPRRVRVDKMKPVTGPDDWTIDGSFIATSGGEDEGFYVTETAEDIVSAIAEHVMPYHPSFITVDAAPAQPTEFPEVFNENLDQAPRDGRVVMGKLADESETPMVWWRNWPGWRAISEMEVMGEPVAPVAWRPLTHGELTAIEIPF